MRMSPRTSATIDVKQPKDHMTSMVLDDSYIYWQKIQKTAKKIVSNCFLLRRLCHAVLRRHDIRLRMHAYFDKRNTACFFFWTFTPKVFSNHNLESTRRDASKRPSDLRSTSLFKYQDHENTPYHPLMFNFCGLMLIMQQKKGGSSERSRKRCRSRIPATLPLCQRRRECGKR